MRRGNEALGPFQRGQSGLEARVGQQESYEGNLVVKIDAEQRLYLQDVPVNIVQLVAGIKTLQPDPALQSVDVELDRSVPWRTVAIVMDQLNAAGVRIVQFL